MGVVVVDAVVPDAVPVAGTQVPINGLSNTYPAGHSVQYPPPTFDWNPDWGGLIAPLPQLPVLCEWLTTEPKPTIAKTAIKAIMITSLCFIPPHRYSGLLRKRQINMKYQLFLISKLPGF